MKITIFIFILLFSNVTYCCVVAKSGPEYDSLISVKKIGHNAFKVSFPKSASGLNHGVSIEAVYYKEKSEYRLGEFRKYIELQDGGENYESIFDLVKINGYIPYVLVYWKPKLGGRCGAFGKSRDLEVE